MKFRFAVLLFAAAAFSACDKKPSASSSSSSPAPAPVLSKFGPAGGRLEAGGARVEIPAGVLEAETEFGLREVPAPEGANAGGRAFEITTERAYFAKPVTVTLPVRLPFGAKPSQISVLLSLGGVTERLRGGEYDAGTETFSVNLERLFPLANNDGPAGAAASIEFPRLMVDVDPALKTVIPAQDGIEWLFLNTVEERAREMMPPVKAAVEKARDGMKAFGLIVPGSLQIGFRPLKPEHGAQANGGDMIEVNTENNKLKDMKILEAAIVHEYTHLVQQLMKIAHLRAASVPVNITNVMPGVGRWVDEGTAEFMATKICAGYDNLLILRLRPDFPLRPIRRWQDPDCHEYAMGIFFCWLDTLYDGVALFRAVYAVHMSGKLLVDDAANDREASRGSWDPLNALDYVLKTTADRKGRTRSMKQVYADFLLRLLWKKDFEPVASNRDNVEPVFGPPGQIVLPAPPERMDWDVPGSDGTLKRSGTVSGESWQIVKVIQVTSTAKASKKTGDLTISIKPEDGMPKDSALLIVFPTRKVLQEPEVGAPGKPVVISEWEDCVSATVWVVDVSLYGGFNLEVTAELGAAGKKADGPGLELKLFSAESSSRYCDADVSFGVQLTRVVTKEELKKFLAGAGPKDDKKRWMRLELSIGGSKSYLYGRLNETEDYIGGGFDGIGWCPLKPGTYPMTAKTQLYGKTLSYTGTFEVKRRDSWTENGKTVLAEKQKVVDRLLAERAQSLADKNDYWVGELNYALVYLYMEICNAHLDVGDLEAGKAAATEGLIYADEDRKLVCNRYLLKCCLFAGDADGAWALHKGQDLSMVPGPGGMAGYFVRFKDDRATAWKLLAEAEKQSGTKPDPPYPPADEQILK